MLRVADFAKSSVKSEEISNYDGEEGTIEEGRKFSSETPGSYSQGEKEDDIAERKPNNYRYDDQEEKRSLHEFDEKKFINTVGLPAGFSVGEVQKQRKGDKRTYYCEMCLVELSSLDTMKSHVSGVKHMKKQMALKNDREDKVRMGLISEEEAQSSTPTVRPIPNPESIKKKIPIRLHEKIRDTMDPVVGLKYIMEYIPVSDAEMEPHYECGLCGNQGQSNGMFSHLMGHKHRQQFMNRMSGNKSGRVCRSDMSQAALLRAAKKHSENHQKLSDLILTRQSDEEYHWPPGKAPWAVERGGSGIPPAGARDYAGNKKHDIKQKPGELVIGVDTKLPALESVMHPSSNDEAQRMIEVGRKLVEMAMGFSGSGLGDSDNRVIQTTMDSVLGKAEENLATEDACKEK